MTTAFLSLQTAIGAALAPIGIAVSLNRVRPIPAAQTSVIVVRLDQSTGTEQALGTIDWSSAFSVECYSRAAGGGADPAASVDTLLADAWVRLSAINAGSLGAMAINLNPQIDWQYDEAETALACAVIRLVVQHRTPFASLAAA